MSKDDLEKRFGTIAVEKGFITAEQLIEAMEIQIFEELEGKKRNLIGIILEDKASMTITQVNEVLETMGLL
jgi:hypothetical protein